MTSLSLKHKARKAENSDAAEWGARAGIAARGLLWLIVGFLALNVTVGRNAKADKQGAFEAIRDQPLGKVMLVALALAFAAHTVFRLLEGTVGRRDEKDDRKRMLKRAWSLCRVVIYGFFTYSTLHFLFAGGGSENAKGPTAKVMSLPAGRTMVGLVGAAIVITGLVMAVRGIRQDFTDRLDMPTGRMRTVVERMGAAGLAGRGLVYALVGSFLVEAALRYDPAKAKGLDAALKTLAGQPFGTGLLLLASAALLSFALWSFLEARYRDL